MCYQVIERYSVCRCIYYQHAIDRCQGSCQAVPERIILVGDSCPEHLAPTGDVANGRARSLQEKKSFDVADKQKNSIKSTRWTISENQTDDRAVCRARYQAHTRGRISKPSSLQSSRSTLRNAAKGHSNMIIRKSTDGLRPQARPSLGSGGASQTSRQPSQPPPPPSPPRFNPGRREDASNRPTISSEGSGQHGCNPQ